MTVCEDTLAPFPSSPELMILMLVWRLDMGLGGPRTCPSMRRTQSAFRKVEKTYCVLTLCC